MQKLVAEIMAAWRRADRLAGDLPDGSRERAAVELASGHLRDVFQALTASGVAAEISAAEARRLLTDVASDLAPAPGERSAAVRDGQQRQVERPPAPPRNA